METNFKDIDKCKKELEFVLTYDELKPHFEKALEKYRKQAAIPGFRKGKAPLSMVKKLVGESIEYSALEEIANNVFRQHVEENDIDILDVGAMTDFNYEPQRRFQFKVEFEVRPEIELETYKGLELKRKKYVIDDSLVDEEINYHKLQNSQLEMDSEAFDDEYVVTLDLQDLDEKGNIIIGQTQKDVKVYIGNKSLAKEFAEGLKGIKEGETKTIQSKDADGNKKKVQVTAAKVEKIVAPEMNEEFFKKVTAKEDIKDLDQFRGTIKNELQKIYDESAEQNLKNDVINEILKLNDVSVPNAFVENILKNAADDYQKRQGKNKKFTTEELDEYKKASKPDATKQAKWFLIKEKIAELEGIKAEEDDIKKFAEDIASKYNMPSDKLVELYSKNPEVMGNVLNDKIMKFLIDNAKVTDIEEVKKPEPQEEVEEL